MSAPTVRTRILIISDTHCATLKGQHGSAKDAPRPPFEAPLPSADILIHCGDLTWTGQMSQYNTTLDMLKEIDAPVKIVIAGNHDLTLDREYIHSHKKHRHGAHEALTTSEAEELLREARDIWTAPDGRAKREGVTFLDEGLHNIDLPNGATACIYASPYTPEFCDWGFPYQRNEDRFNLPAASLSDASNIAVNPIPSFGAAERPVDVLLTHGPSWELLDRTFKGDKAGCPHLLRAVMASRPLVHCFGHIHEGWGAQRLRWSDQADELMRAVCSTKEWTEGGLWQVGVSDLKDLEIDQEAAKKEHAVSLDLTQLQRGKDTVVINAAIMNLKYEPSNAPFLIDVELPRAS